MTLQYVLEHFAVAVSALSGVLAARGKQVDLFGVVVLALVTALGGGTVRDVLLDSMPVAWMQDTAFLWNALAVALVGFFVVRWQRVHQTTFLVADAFALALFTMVGVRKALDFTVPPSGAVAMGVVTGVAGGMIRDVLRGEIPLVFRRDIYLYATAALCGSCLFLALHVWRPDAPGNMLLGVSATLMLRLAAIRWKLGLPVFHGEGAGGAGDGG